MLLRDETWPRETEHDRQQNEPNSDVQAVKSNECEIRRAKQIAANRETMIKDQSMPFHGSTGEKQRSEDDRCGEPFAKRRDASSAQRRVCEMHGDAARYERKRARDHQRQAQCFGRSGAGLDIAQKGEVG